MNIRKDDSSNEYLLQFVETFWETFPPFWHRIRAHIRHVAVERFGITVEQFHILRHIRQGHGSVSDLANIKQTSRSAISQVVNLLVTRGLITQTRYICDRRYIRLALTHRGNALLDEIFEDTRQWMMQQLSSLDDEELQRLATAMDSLRKIQQT